VVDPKVIVPYDESQAVEMSLYLGRPRPAATIERVELLSPTFPMFTDRGPFARLDPNPMEFPTAVLELPLSDCGGVEGAQRIGFEPFDTRPPEEPLPHALSLMVLFPNHHEIGLWIRHPAHPDHAAERAALEIMFPDRHPAEWLRAVFTNGLTLLVTPLDWSRYDTIGAAVLAS
jgi:hypothetical protein